MSMNLNQVLDKYRALSRSTLTAFHLPEMETQLISLEVRSWQVAATDASDTKVRQAIHDFTPQAGWIGYQSGNQHFQLESEADALELYDNWGVLMNAEVAVSGRKSLSVRYTGMAGWVVTEAHVGAEGANESFIAVADCDHYEPLAAGEYLADTVAHIATIEALDKLQYQRFWDDFGQYDASQAGRIGIQPVFACFNGFGG